MSRNECQTIAPDQVLISGRRVTLPPSSTSFAWHCVWDLHSVSRVGQSRWEYRRIGESQTRSDDQVSRAPNDARSARANTQRVAQNHCSQGVPDNYWSVFTYFCAMWACQNPWYRTTQKYSGFMQHRRTVWTVCRTVIFHLQATSSPRRVRIGRARLAISNMMPNSGERPSSIVFQVCLPMRMR